MFKRAFFVVLVLLCLSSTFFAGIKMTINNSPMYYSISAKKNRTI